MKKRNLLVLAGALLIGSGALVGCGGGKTPASSEKPNSETPATSGNKNAINLKVWCANEDDEFMKATIEKFKAANPGTEYNFTVEPVSEGDALTAVQKDLALTADVFHFAGDQLVTLQKNAALYQIPSSFVNGLGLSEGCLGAGQIDGKQYGIPFTPNTYFMYYDSSVYTENDVKSVTNMLKVDVTKHAGYKYNAAFDMGNSWYFQSIMYSSGATMNAETGKFDNGDTAAKFVAKWNQNEKLVMAGGTANIGVDAAAVVSGAWDAGAIQKVLGENYACAPLPTLDFGAGEVAWKAVGDYKMIGVKSTTAVPQHAAKFAAFLSSAEIQTDRFVARATAPTNEKALENDALKENKAIIAQTQTLKNTFAQPSSVYDKNGYWNAWKAFWTDLQAADSDEKAVAALKAFNDVLGTNFEASKAQ